MPAQLAAFPKCFIDDMFAGRMSLFDWIEGAAQHLQVDGLETYFPTLESGDDAYLQRVRSAMENCGLVMPMMCVSPDWTQPNADERKKQSDNHKRAIDATAALGGQFCRVLSGQRRPDVSRAEGIAWTIEGIESVLPHAQSCGVTLTLENHYKDPQWLFPEFAQAKDVFIEIVQAIDAPNFGVNYDPSNALIAGDDPLEVLEMIKHRVVTMHASDRSLSGGTIEDLRRIDRDPIVGYADVVQHGVIGRGLIPYDEVFKSLCEINFAGWISIEDGPDADVGWQHLWESQEFLRAKMSQHNLG
jgi:sugar phosphate isomerase/epimerase